MRCHHCLMQIAAGVEARKMIVAYDQADGTVKVFGYQMPDGPLSAATGSLRRGWHHKCFHIARKREARTGGEDQGDLTALHAGLREVADRIGKPVGDPEVTEAHRAQTHGGPYPHGHQFRLDDYQLTAHLRHAHGCDAGHGTSLEAAHQRAHARQVLAVHLGDRADDPGHTEPDTGFDTADWRQHAVTDI